MNRRIPKMRKLAMACAGLALSWMTANAAVTTTRSGTTYTINIPENEEYGIEEALAAGGTSTATINWTDHIRKTGKGRLNMNVNFARWWGNLYIDEGVVYSACQYGLGVDNDRGDKVYCITQVNPGATLILSNTGNGFAVGNHPIYLSGTGDANQKGALVLEVWSGADTAKIYPGRIYLDADATWAIQHKGEANSLFASKQIKLLNHTLTMTGEGGNDEHRTIFSTATVISGGANGKIVVGNKLRLAFRQNTTLSGNGEIELVGTGSVDMIGFSGFSTVIGSEGWKLTGNSDTSKGISGNYTGFGAFSRTANVWSGPMDLRQSTYVKMNWTLGSGYYGLLTLGGKISGAGGIYGTGRGGGSPDYVILGSGENDFTGGIGYTNATLCLAAATALPATGKAAKLTDASLMFCEPVAQSTQMAKLPELDMTVSSGKTATIGSMLDSGAEGATMYATTPTLTKSGEGTLDSKAVVSAGTINLENGVLKMKLDATTVSAAKRAASAGLNAGHKWLGISDTPFKAAYENGKYLTLCITNRVALSPEIYYLQANYYPAGNSEWGEHYYQIFNSWDGYIWNNTDQVKTWKVVDTCNSIQRLTIGGTENQYAMESDRVSPWTDGISDAYAPQIYTVTLQPGPNRFIVRTYDRFAYKNFQHGSVRVKGLANWTDAHGLMYTEKLDSVDMNDYHPFIDPGDGSLFTRETSFEYPAVNLVRGNGGSLDLQGGTLEAVNIEGKPTVLNGALSVSGNWALTAAQVTDASYAASGLSFGEAVALTISDDELAGIKPKGRGYLLASGFSGNLPVLGANLAEAGWELVLENGDLRLCRPTGLAIIFR